MEEVLLPFLFTKNLLFFFTNNQIKSSDAIAILHTDGLKSGARTADRRHKDSSNVATTVNYTVSLLWSWSKPVRNPKPRHRKN
jgi:hypothetical protein